MRLAFLRFLAAMAGLLLAASPVLRALLPFGDFAGLSRLAADTLKAIAGGGWLDLALGVPLLALAATPARHFRAFASASGMRERLLVEEGAAGQGGRTGLADCLFIGAVTAAAALPYLPQIGLHSDDHAFLAAFAFHPDQSLSGYFSALYDGELDRARPVHFLYLALLHALFGFTLIGYQLVNLAVIAGCAAAFHLVLRAMEQPRALALAAPMVFAALPHFSTDRMWISAFQIPLCVLLYLVSLLTDLRSLSAAGGRFWAWRGASALAMAGSVLAYEITLFLFLLNPVIVWRQAWRKEASGAAPPGLRTRVAAGFVISGLLVSAALAFKAGVTQRIEMDAGVLHYVTMQVYLLISPLKAIDYDGGLNVWRAFYIDFVHYGVGLPYIALVALRDLVRPWEAALALGLGLVLFVHLRAAAREAGARPAEGHAWRRVCLAGLVVYGLGYTPFLLTPQVLLTPTGVGNRVTMAAAIGVALCFVGVIGGLAGRAREAGARASLFAGLVAFVATAGFLVNAAIASFWGQARERQAEVLETVADAFPTLPEGTLFLLDGVCPYVGPGIVFETSWDMTGALRLMYRDPTLEANVLAGNWEVRDSGLAIRFYGLWTEHAYGPHVIVFDVASGVSRRLTDAEAARRYLAGSSELGPDCPPGREGLGMPIF